MYIGFQSAILVVGGIRTAYAVAAFDLADDVGGVLEVAGGVGGGCGFGVGRRFSEWNI